MDNSKNSHQTTQTENPENLPFFQELNDWESLTFDVCRVTMGTPRYGLFVEWSQRYAQTNNLLEQAVEEWGND